MMREKVGWLLSIGWLGLIHTAGATGGWRWLLRWSRRCRWSGLRPHNTTLVDGNSAHATSVLVFREAIERNGWKREMWKRWREKRKKRNEKLFFHTPSTCEFDEPSLAREPLRSRNPFEWGDGTERRRMVWCGSDAGMMLREETWRNKRRIENRKRSNRKKKKRKKTQLYIRPYYTSLVSWLTRLFPSAKRRSGSISRGEWLLYTILGAVHSYGYYCIIHLLLRSKTDILAGL